MKSYSVKENHIGSVISEILQYKQTFCYFIIRIIYLFLGATRQPLGQNNSVGSFQNLRY